jgi:hypothetical protein
MLRYLRGKGFLDLLYDGIRWVAPGRVGEVAAAAVVVTLSAGLMYVANYPALSRWFSP